MNLKSVLAFTKPVTGFIKDHRRGILTAVNIGATLYAVYRAAKDGPKFKEIIDTMPEDSSTWDKVKELAPAVAPTVGATLLSIGSAGLMYKDCTDTIRGLSDAYMISSTMLQAVNEHTEKIVGPEKAKEIREAAVSANAPSLPSGSGVDKVIVTGHGNDLFLDDWSGRYFLSDINFIKKAVNDLNYQLMNDMYISLNEYYAYLDLPGTGAGREYGWNMDNGRMIELTIDAGLTEVDKPYTIISFRNLPMYRDAARRW